MTKDEAHRWAKRLDELEADLAGIQQTLWSLRCVLQKIVGQPVGWQYPHQPEKI